MIDLVTHSPIICDALWSICHIGGLWTPLQNCFAVLHLCDFCKSSLSCQSNIIHIVKDLRLYNIILKQIIPWQHTEVKKQMEDKNFPDYVFFKPQIIFVGMNSHQKERNLNNKTLGRGVSR